MSEKRFDLTVRREDMLEVFEGQTAFRLFSTPNYPRLAVIGIFVFGMFANAFNIWNIDQPGTMFFFCVIGAAYSGFLLYGQYNEVRKSRKGINSWIANTERYKQHWLVINENDFVYHRDNEVHRYDLSKSELTHHNESFFVLKTGSENIVIPAKSFVPGEYSEFAAMVDALIAKVNTSTESA